MSSIFVALDLGTISETVVSWANFHIPERVLLEIARSLIMTKKIQGPMWVLTTGLTVPHVIVENISPFTLDV